MRSLAVRTRSTTTRDRNLQLRGAPSPPSEISSLFSRSLLCNSVMKWSQNVEKIARFPGGGKSVESCHVCGCHGNFGPDLRPRRPGTSVKTVKARKCLSWVHAKGSCNNTLLTRDEKTWAIAKRRFLIITSRAQIQN